MAGQQGLGLAQGFMQGYSFMQGMDERKQRMGLRDQQAQRATETHQRQGERHDLTMDQARLQREQQQAQQVLGKMAHGLPLAEEEEGFLRDNPKYWPVLDPQTDKSLETAKGVMDPNSPVGMRSPETLDAINQMFGHRINRGEGGRKRIDGIYPGKAPGTVAFSVEVEGEDGRKYRAPMTVNRGTAGDDEVMQTPVDQLLGQVKGYDMLRQPFRNSPEAQARASKMLAVLTGKTPERSSAYRQTQELTALGLDPEQARNQAYGIKPDGGEADWRRLNNSDLYNQRTGDVRGGVGGQGNDGTGGLDSSVMSQIQQTARNFHGSFNPDGTFMGIPQGAREKYTLAMERAQQLVQRGVPVFEASNLANLSVNDQLTEADARQLAEQEAKQQHGGWFQGDDREQYIQQRVPELLQESREALGRYQQIVGGQGQQQGLQRGQQQAPARQPQQQPQRQGLNTQQPTASQPQQGEMPVVRSDADYASLPPGAVFVDENGKRYQKPE